MVSKFVKGRDYSTWQSLLNTLEMLFIKGYLVCLKWEIVFQKVIIGRKWLVIVYQSDNIKHLR